MTRAPTITENIETLYPYVLDYAEYTGNEAGTRLARAIQEAGRAGRHVENEADPRESKQSWRGFFLGAKTMLDGESPLARVCDTMRIIFSLEGNSAYDSETTLDQSIKALLAATPRPPLVWESTSGKFVWLVGNDDAEVDEARCTIDVHEDGSATWQTYNQHAGRGTEPTLEAAKRAAEAAMEITEPFPDEEQ